MDRQPLLHACDDAQVLPLLAEAQGAEVRAAQQEEGRGRLKPREVKDAGVGAEFLEERGVCFGEGGQYVELLGDNVRDLRLAERELKEGLLGEGEHAFGGANKVRETVGKRAGGAHEQDPCVEGAGARAQAAKVASPRQSGALCSHERDVDTEELHEPSAGHSVGVEQQDLRVLRHVKDMEFEEAGDIARMLDGVH